MTDRRFVIPVRTRVGKKKFMVFCLTLLIFLTLILLKIVINEFNRNYAIHTSVDPVIEEEEISETMDPKLKEMWLTNKAINPDYIGQIVFDSGIIDLPIVQARSVYDRNGDLYTFYTEDGQLVTDPEGYTGNDVYIWSNWKSHEYDPDGEGGSVFMHYQNDLDDQNLIIFGHHFARDYLLQGDREFTPLDLLLKEENYEANKSLKLIFNDEIREYVITNVFVININDDYDTQIMRTDMNRDLSGNHDPSFFKSFIDHMNEISAYRTAETVNTDDRILTLITCIEHQPELREIVVCRQTGPGKEETPDNHID